MKALVQRVSSASVSVSESEVAHIGAGVLVYLGVLSGDGEDDARRLAGRVALLRHFPDEQGRMQFSLKEVGGSALVVSQFTLAASFRRGRRPSFELAAAPERAQALYLSFVEALREQGVPSRTGSFGALMSVCSVNEGPQTFLLQEPS